MAVWETINDNHKKKERKMYYKITTFYLSFFKHENWPDHKKKKNWRNHHHLRPFLGSCGYNPRRWLPLQLNRRRALHPPQLPFSREHLPFPRLRHQPPNPSWIHARNCEAWVWTHAPSARRSTATQTSRSNQWNNFHFQSCVFFPTSSAASSILSFSPIVFRFSNGSRVCL